MFEPGLIYRMGPQTSRCSGWLSPCALGYRKAAENAKHAGFDGVLVHGANGYLLDQFLQSSTNIRTDEYSGSHANRARLLLQVTDAAISVWGTGRVGVHLAPRGDGGIGSYVDHSMGDENPVETFKYVARELGKRKIAFISTREKDGPDSIGPMLKKEFGGKYVANEAFTKEIAESWLASEKADAVAFGVPFIANPDLPERLKANKQFNAVRPEYFYRGGNAGYTDYPTL